MRSGRKSGPSIEAGFSARRVCRPWPAHRRGSGAVPSAKKRRDPPHCPWNLRISEIHPRIGVLSPSPEAVARAIAARTNSRVMISGAKAANLLGLSTQVPAQNLFLTDGRSHSIRIGNQLVVLKHVAPSKMIGAGTEAGVVIQAVRFLGRRGIGEIPVESFSKKIPVSVKAEIKRLAPGVPVWLQPALARLSAQA